MVLTGTVNGENIIFHFSPPDTFTAQMSRVIKGRYIVQLRLFDEAGNDSSYTTIYTYIDFNKMKYSIIDSDFSFNSEEEEIGFIRLDNDFIEKTLQNSYRFTLLKSNYLTNILQNV